MPIMQRRVKARLAIVPLTLALLAAGSAGSSSGASSAGALARAYAIRVVVPGGGASPPEISSPPNDAVAPGSNFSYTGSDGPTGTASHGFVTALDVHLTADHGGLPAGSEIQVGYAEVSVQAPPKARPVQPAPKPSEGVIGTSKKKSTNKAPEPKKPIPGIPPEQLPRRLPPNIHPKLSPTPGGYVFPVYGPSSYSDTFQAVRGDVPGGWHHGDDIFAPLGAPVLAVTKGTVFSVGWNDLGGNRLWLRDEQ